MHGIKSFYWRCLVTCLISFYCISVHGQHVPQAPYAYGTTLNELSYFEPKRPLTSEAEIPSSSRTIQEVTQVNEYSDAFGRPLQTVMKQYSPIQADFVTAHEYDANGRETYQYLPFTSTFTATGDVIDDGKFKSNPFQQQIAFYNSQLSGQTNETNIGSSNLNWAYNKKVYENSPLDRVTSYFSAGTSWVGSEGSGTEHTNREQSVINTVKDSVRIWNISNSPGSLPSTPGNYPAGLLFKSIKTDEQGRQMIEFKDLDGRVVLTKQQLNSVKDDGLGSGHVNWKCTYYVFDDFGNARFVITPLAVSLINGTWIISQIQADELCYRMEYDKLNRQIVNKVPGVAEVWNVYDQWNRKVLYQDGNLRTSNKWIFTKFDGLERPIYTGIYTNTTNVTQASVQALIVSQNLARFETYQTSTFPYYTTTSAFPASNIVILYYNYYDGYSWGAHYGAFSSKDNSFDGNFASPSATVYPYPQPLVQSAYTQGLTTGYADDVNTTAYYYDANNKPLQTKSSNISGGVDIFTIQTNFAGKAIQTYLRQQIAGSVNPQTHTISSKYVYDAMLRLTETRKSVDGGTEQVIGAMQYNKLLQVSKVVYGSSLESITYEYNVRGWQIGGNKSYLTGSTSNYFGYEVGYDKTTSALPGNSYTAMYNGNMAGTVWKSAGDNINRKYDYTYDYVSQISTAPFKQNSSGSSWTNTSLDFSVTGITYDLNSNISTLSQNGFLLGAASTAIDNLAYDYKSGSNPTNKLRNITDASNNPTSPLGDFHYASSKPAGNTDYVYDSNGNPTKDDNKGISAITYNNLNLPLTITIPGKGSIQYVYDAVGKKTRKIVTDITVAGKTITVTTDYIGDLVYKSKSTVPAQPTDYSSLLQFISHEQGRIRYIPVNGTIAAHFCYDYFLRDNNQNVRMVLTDEQQQDIFPAATVETASFNGGTPSSFESQYYKINPAAIVPVANLAWYSGVTGRNYQNQNNGGNPANYDPYSQPANTTAQVYKLNGQTGDKYGLGITIKVMAGDKISIFANSFWHNTGQQLTSFPITSLLSAFVNAFGSTSTMLTGSQNMPLGTTMNGASDVTGPLTSLLNGTANQPSPLTQPKAAINWILFDDQFRPVSIGTDLVSSTGDLVRNHSKLNMAMQQNGYLYIYCSNESNIDVYFDNLQVVNTRGPILEETHYYPDGMTMAAISDRAWNKTPNFYHYQFKEMQNLEFSDGTGLEEYDFGARVYEPQTGRWTTTDPACQFPSPYVGMGNNWVNGRDPDGRFFGVDDILVAAVGFVAGYLQYGISQNNWGGKALLSGLAGAVIAEAGYLTMGGGLAASGPGVAGLGGFGAMASAFEFSTSYLVNTATVFIQYEKQIAQASEWGAFGLIAGYSFFSAVNAGFSSKGIRTKLANFAKSVPDPKVPIELAEAPFTGRAASGMYGAIVSRTGILWLGSYDPVNNTWKVPFTVFGKILGYAFTGMAAGQAYYNDYDLEYSSSNTFFLNFVASSQAPVYSALMQWAGIGFWNYLQTYWK